MQRAVNKILLRTIRCDKEDRSVGSLIYRDVDQERQAKIASDKAALASASEAGPKNKQRSGALKCRTSTS